MEISLQENIIDTLSYFDVFDYPLTFSEIKKYLGLKIEISDDEITDSIHSIPVIQELNGYYYFLGRREIVEKRIERSEISIQKFAHARIIAKILSKIPTIKYIGVSGSLSMHNSGMGDDIDLFFITYKNTLWTTRFLVNLVLMVLGQKRDRNGKKTTDRICPNMFMEEGKLTLPKKNRTLYVAHEVVQVKTIFNKDDAYNRFINKNKWVKNFLPNISITIPKRSKLNRTQKMLNTFFKPVELSNFILQKMYMSKYLTIEVVTRSLAMFHPVNKEKIIIDLYSLKSARYKDLYFENQWIDREEARFYFDEKKIRILN